MAHKRKEIRDRVVELIQEGSTDAALKVFGDRLKSLKSDEYPSIVVFCRSESSDVDTDGPRTYMRKLQCIVEGCIRANLDDQDSADDALEDMASQIETVFYDNPRLNLSDVLDSKLIKTEIEFATNGDKPIGVVQLTYEILYLSN